MTPSLNVERIVYKDLNRSFGEDSSNALVTNIRVIHNELMNLFTTTIGEVDFEPTLGSSLMDRLFEPQDDKTIWALEHDLYLAIAQWMSSRIIVNQEDIRVSYSDDTRGLDVDIAYEIVGLGITVESNLQIRR